VSDLGEAAGGRLRAGSRVGPYRLVAPLGEGAMGTVFRAVREPGGELVALKILKDELAHDELYRRRFAREARAASEVHHAHLLSILDAGEADGRFFLATRYVAGRSLQERLQTRGRLDAAELVRLVTHVGGALDALHRHGIVHRDVKSSNILLDEAEHAVLADLGLAKGRAYTVLTLQGRLLGTMYYMAPELIRGGPATPASDIYALGCVAFECLSGAPPYADRGVFAAGVAHLSEEPGDPGAGRPELPRRLSWAVTRALVKDPAGRPPTATAYATMLRTAGG
jgi:serine/threonine protein kinase